MDNLPVFFVEPFPKCFNNILIKKNYNLSKFTYLLCLEVKLAQGGSMAVGVSDMQQVTHDFT